MSKTLRFSYQMELVFSDYVRSHQFTLRMIPDSDLRQQIQECSVRVSPECELVWDVDAFGNKYVYGTIEQEHNVFGAQLCGVAEVNSFGSEEVSASDRVNLYQSTYTRPGTALEKYLTEVVRSRGESEDSYVLRLMHSVHEKMEYRKGVTDIATSAEEAIILGQGVCQDYAHIMIALLRMSGIPARYAVGMMMGEGYSHAWVEAAVSGRWLGLDPTNDMPVDDTYIKISNGRDYQDCIVNRGVFCGCVTQQQSVKVIVNEV